MPDLDVIIAIGSTGVKALENCIHLANAGALDRDQMRVIIIDKDAENEETAHVTRLNNRTIAANNIAGNMDFFRTKFDIRVWPFNNALAEIRNDDHGAGDTFHDYVFENPNTDDILLNMTHRNQVQNWELDRGFYGRPNIGATLFKLVTEISGNINRIHQDDPNLNGDPRTKELAANAEFKNLKTDVVSGQFSSINVFVVGSVFGGTGASIFPNVARMIRKLLPGNCRVGGALVLPYFSVTPPDNDARRVDSSEFIKRTKVALEQYHSQGIIGGNNALFDALYFVGDKPFNNTGAYALGGKKQKNHTHVVDLYSGYAVCDYFNQNGQNPGLKLAWLSAQPFNAMTLDHLPDHLAERLTKMAYFSYFNCASIWPTILQDNREINQPLGRYVSKVCGLRRRGIGEDRRNYENERNEKFQSFKDNSKKIAEVCYEYLKNLYDLSLNGIDWKAYDEQGTLNLQGQTVNLYNDKTLGALINTCQQNGLGGAEEPEEPVVPILENCRLTDGQGDDFRTITTNFLNECVHNAAEIGIGPFYQLVYDNVNGGNGQ